jgi:hypothetical protein
MPLANSKIIPAVFWVGFLALGFATSIGGPAKHRDHVARPAKTSLAPKELVAQTEKPTAAKTADRPAAAQD